MSDLDTDTNPTLPMLLKYHVARQSPSRVDWANRKQKASKVVDVRIFKNDLGPTYDAFRDISEAAAKIKKKGGRLDANMKKAIADRGGQVKKCLDLYNALIKQQLAKPGLTAAQKTAWEDLRSFVKTHLARIGGDISIALR